MKTATIIDVQEMKIEAFRQCLEDTAAMARAMSSTMRKIAKAADEECSRIRTLGIHKVPG